MFNEHNRPETPKAAPPIEMIGAFLDFQRATLLWKVSGLTDEQLRRPMVPSGTCLLALVKHSAAVETSWFQTKFAGLDVPNTWTRTIPDGDWRLEPDDTAERDHRFLSRCLREIARNRSDRVMERSVQTRRPEGNPWLDSVPHAGRDLAPRRPR